MFRENTRLTKSYCDFLMSNVCNYPLRFRPLFKQYLWGGRRLETMLGKPIGDGEDFAESWEIVDHGEDQSIVSNGALEGMTLKQIVEQHPQELFGKHADNHQFPLLFKFLDCNRTLSVQVHPNDEQGAQLDPPDLGKTEAWVVIAADPGSKLYAGLKAGVTREELKEALEAGTCDQCLHEFEPQVGDCIFIKAGTVHALGSGLVIAEIQQASNTTFRLFDWNRVDAAGNPRQLHIEQSLEVTNYDRGPVAPQTPELIDDSKRERLVDCDKFVLDRCHWESVQGVGGDERFHLVVLLEGKGKLGDVELKAGETCLLPAAAGKIGFEPEGKVVLLDICLP